MPAPNGLGVEKQLEEQNLRLGACDYTAVFDVRNSEVGQSGTWFGGPDPELIDSPLLDGPLSPATSFSQDVFNARIRTESASFVRVRDGLSNTVMLVEQAGKPARLSTIEIQAPSPTEGAWVTAEYSSFYANGVNQDNYSGPYSFHSGVTVVMCDASVHFWSRDIEQEVMIALLTRSGSEILINTDWQN